MGATYPGQRDPELSCSFFRAWIERLAAAAFVPGFVVRTDNEGWSLTDKMIDWVLVP
jgi:hypothetical protein